MSRILAIIGIIYFLLMIVFGTACHHDPIDMDPIDPMDTITDPMDTTKIPCDPEIIYFEFDILPILNSNCALSGCHDATTAQEGIILDSYENVISSGKITPFDLSDSDIYEVIVETDLDKRMPPDPNLPLNAAQVEIISKWILQGAENLTCDREDTECDLEGVSFSDFVLPTLQDNCVGCHSGGNPAGGISLVSYENIKTVAVSGLLPAAINWAPGAPRMPQNGSKLDDCTIEKIEAWIADGAMNN